MRLEGDDAARGGPDDRPCRGHTAATRTSPKPILGNPSQLRIPRMSHTVAGYRVAGYRERRRELSLLGGGETDGMSVGPD
jgi:hypothetical protein